MSFQHKTYNSHFLNHVQTNTVPAQPDAKYGVRVEPTAVAPGTNYWRIVGVHHLTPEENGSRHNAFVEVLDEQGNRVRDPNLKIGWTWEGRSEADLTTPLDKPDHEPAGDVPIQKGMRLALWLVGDGRPSERATNLHFEHPDERTAAGEIWNSFGHHSFYVVFQRAVKTQNGDGNDGGLDEPRRLPPPLSIPNLFTNQQLINAFFFAAQTLRVVGDELMQKAGLDVHQLAADETTRQTRYTGTELAQLPNLTAGERLLLANNLLRELRNARRWRGQVNAPAGVNLRDKPTTVDSTVLTTLSMGTPLDVLHEMTDWLFVAADAETAGFASAQFVTRASEPTLMDSSFLRTDPAAQHAPLAPATAEQIILGAAAGPGARNLAAIWNRYGGLLALLANRLQIDVTVALAVLAVESGGAAFGADGRLLIRFENHLFYRAWGQHHQEQFFQHFAFNQATAESWLDHQWRATPQAPFLPLHRGDAGTQALEWQVFTFAAGLDEQAAQMSISMGAPQILGSNYARIGYATVQAMFNAFSRDERNQLLGFFDYIRTDHALLTALRNQDYVAFARGYNGAGQAEAYGSKIRDGAQAAKLLQEAPALVTFDPTAPEVAPLPDALDANLAFLPMPELPDRLVSVPADQPAKLPKPELGDNAPNPPTQPSARDRRQAEIQLKVLEAWAAHMEQGLQNNTLMFNQLLKAFMRPYYLTIVMYMLLFLVGIGLFLTAAWLSTQAGKDAFTLLFGGLGVITFLTFFISRPLAALEENLLLITRLGVIYNTYWTRLLYMQESKTIQADLEDATNDTIAELDKLTDKSSELAKNRPGLGVR